MSEMVERLAKVIGEAYDGSADPVETPNNWARAVFAARAALTAAREPTKGMVEAAAPKSDDPYNNVDDLILEPSRRIAVRQWQAMIDEALKP